MVHRETTNVCFRINWALPFCGGRHYLGKEGNMSSFWGYQLTSGILERRCLCFSEGQAVWGWFVIMLANYSHKLEKASHFVSYATTCIYLILLHKWRKNSIITFPFIKVMENVIFWNSDLKCLYGYFCIICSHRKLKTYTTFISAYMVSYQSLLLDSSVSNVDWKISTMY